MKRSHPSFVSVTNIPTPYRLHFYKVFSQVLRDKNIELQVWFMAKTEPGRYWQLNPRSFEFKYRFSSGFHPLIHERIFHFNPNLLFSLLKKPPKWLLLSGSWYFPTFICALLIARLRGIKTIIWNESNLAYVEYSQSFINTVRGKVLSLGDAYAVPGQWAKEYVSFHVPASKKRKFLQLPNVVDEEKYLSGVRQRAVQKDRLRQKWDIPSDKRVIVSLTRLEPIKGLNQMLAGWLQFSYKSKTIWLIAGDGSLRQNLQTEIQTAGMEGSIRLLGHRTEDEILELLALADAFALPSLGDPYPLAVLEAMFAGLPLLLSNRVGCHPETLKPGKNGLLFDPYQVEDVRQTLDNFLTLTPRQWKTMGEHSLQLASERFGTEIVVQNFVTDILAL